MIDQNLVNQLNNVASQYPGILRLGIFGSHARGEATKDSDIDILFEHYYLDDDHNGIDNALECLDELEEVVKSVADARPDFVPLSGVLNSKYEHFKNNVLSDVIWIYER